MLFFALLAAQTAHITTTGTLIRDQPANPAPVEARRKAPDAPAANQVRPAVATPESEFAVGRTIAADVTAKLGRPNSTETNSDGTVTIRYISVHTHVKGASFVPIVGLFAGGAKGTSATRAFTFGADGLLKSYSTGDFETHCKSFGGCR